MPCVPIRHAQEGGENGDEKARDLPHERFAVSFS